MDFELLVKGSIVGHLVGDALGYPFEGIENIGQYQIEMVRGRHQEAEGSWSSPGSFCLATMQSINDSEGLDLYDLMNRFNDVYIAGYLCPGEECRDLSPISSQAIKNYSNGMPPDKCGLKDETTDNDCIARILPIGLYFASSPLDELLKNVHEVCRLTHSSVICEVSCSVYCMIVRNLLLQKREKAIEAIYDVYRSMNLPEHIRALNLVDEYRKEKKEGKKHVIDSLWSAWHCHSKNENNFLGCLFDSVRLGNDTNTTASLAGGINGLVNSLDGIPYKWLNMLKLESDSMEIIQKFTNSVVKRSF